MARPTVLASVIAAVCVTAVACSRPAPPKMYPLSGQVLSVDTERKQITIRHEDIPNLMPGMTMSFPVADEKLLQGREPGELVMATLEVTDAIGRLKTIERVGFQALPTDSNAADMAGTMLSAGDAMPDAAFIDQTNQRRSISEWRGSVLLVTFIYTRCPLPTFCPLMDQQFAKIQRAVAGDAALRARVRLVSVSFDPEHDTPAVLAKHAERLKADAAIWTFLTGDRPTVDRFAARMGVGVLRPDGDPMITHNLRTVLVGADGKIVRIYSGNEWTVDTAVTDLRAAAARRP